VIVIGLADIHGEAGAIHRIAAELEAADVVVLSGDVTNFGHRRDAVRVIQEISHYARRLLAVPGNCDYPDVSTYLDDLGINLHGRNRVIEGIGFLGVGGSLPAPGLTPFEFSDDELGGFLRAAAQDFPDDTPTILVAHQPPLDTPSDQIYSGEHVGSLAVRTFIEARQPLLCLTGHIHEAAGIAYLDQTRIVNPGPLGRGGYVYAEVGREIEQLEIRSTDR
jgi:Icc-related predicted phosphoesterase